MMNENFLNCGLVNWISIAMISGTGFLVMLVLLLSLMALGRYILEGSSNKLTFESRSFDHYQGHLAVVVQDRTNGDGTCPYLRTRDASGCLGTASEVPKPQE